jgi:uncharacterized Zn-binding protein involved in type VI secretion
LDKNAAAYTVEWTLSSARDTLVAHRPVWESDPRGEKRDEGGPPQKLAPGIGWNRLLHVRRVLMGSPASRITDMHVCPMVTVVVPHVGGPILPPGAVTVLIGGLPAARVTDMAVCVGPPDVIVLGSFTVLTEELPQARIGDLTAHGGTIVLGEFTVLVGG